MKYTASGYTFTNVTSKRKYIQYLKKIVDFNAKGIMPTRREVQIAIGDPDPSIKRTVKLWWQECEYSMRCNWGNSRWAAMVQAGLIRSERDPHGNAVHYQVTPNGLFLLHSVC